MEEDAEIAMVIATHVAAAEDAEVKIEKQIAAEAEILAVLEENAQIAKVLLVTNLLKEEKEMGNL